MKRLLILPILLLTILISEPAFSSESTADLNKGWDAYKDGD